MVINHHFKIAVMVIKLFLLFLFTGAAYKTIAQNMGGMHHMLSTKKIKNKTITGNNADTMPTMKMGIAEGMNMHSLYSLNLPMNRNGSGTGWQPDATPMYGDMLQKGQWQGMLMGNIFIRESIQNIGRSGKRGGDKIDAPNWMMGMASRPVGGKGLLSLTAMISLDPLTVGGYGYPLLFQTGETWKGKELVDRQHPHDLFSAVTVGYTQMLSKAVDLSLVLGYPGEPALGPVAFMHRSSAFNNPDAVLGHHWQDATHISFGTATLGLRYKNIKLEGSLFNGKEPDENRYNFDAPRLNSYAFRFSANPSPVFSLQLSHAFLTSPDHNVFRTTASILHTRLFNAQRFISSAMVWGYNAFGAEKQHSFLLESNYTFYRHSVYGRYELVQKDAGQLNLKSPLFAANPMWNINALTAGYARQLFKVSKIWVTAGSQLTVNLFTSQLQPVYGQAPLSAALYLKISPALFSHVKM